MRLGVCPLAGTSATPQYGRRQSRKRRTVYGTRTSDAFKVDPQRIADKIPGIDRIDTERTSDGRLLLRVQRQGLSGSLLRPSRCRTGTLKLSPICCCSKTPTPPPFICIEEPENGLYHKLLETLANEFREHAIRRKNGSQVFVTTHQPYFVDALDPQEVWILDKGADGFSTIQRASEDPFVKNMVEEGLPLGAVSGTAIISTRGKRMHFEILVEDLSGKKMLESLVPRIIGDQHSFRIHGYRGLGRIPKNLSSSTDASKRQLLDQLPGLLRGYGRKFADLPRHPSGGRDCGLRSG